MRRILCVGALTMDTIFRLADAAGRAGQVHPRSRRSRWPKAWRRRRRRRIARLGGEAALWASAGDDCDRRPAGGSRFRARASIRRGCGAWPVRARAFRPSSWISQRRADDRAEIRCRPDGGAGGCARSCRVRCGDDRCALAGRGGAGAGGGARPPVFRASSMPMSAARGDRAAGRGSASHVVASEGGAALVTGADDTAAGGRAAVGPAIRASSASRPAPKGCWWGEGGTVRHTPAPEVEADRYAGGGRRVPRRVCGRAARGLGDAQRSSRFASAAAAIKCTRFGGRPRRADRAPKLRRFGGCAEPGPRSPPAASAWRSRLRITRQGCPRPRTPAGMSRVTTLPAPMVEPSPMLTPPTMMVPAPIQQCLPMVIGLLTHVGADRAGR